MYNKEYLKNMRDQVNKIVDKEIQKGLNPITNSLKIDKSIIPKNFFKKIKKLIEELDKNASFDERNNRFKVKWNKDQVIKTIYHI